jgi:dihydrofolate synthase/folylpolyglutamate synthase
MNPRECQAYLERVEVYGVKFGLDNIRTVLEDLGRPQDDFPSVLVGGTNGKGSVSAMLTEILSLHGLRAGLYTSPHLISVRERVRLGRRPVSRADFCRLVGRIKASCDRLLAAGRLEARLTYFEHLTALALLYFREKKADIAVLEVGMGGRFDATNVVTPLLSVITTIGLDHQKFLGRTLSRIAFEKAGIIRPGVPVVCGPEPAAALRVIRRRAREEGAPLIEASAPGNRLEARRGSRGYRFTYRRGKETYRFRPGLAGLHQGWNASIALTAASALSRTWRALDRVKTIRGIERARWPGRLEVFGRRPLVVLDGAHNPDGARVLRDYVRNCMPRPLFLVFGVMRDKDVAPMTRMLFPLARKVVLTTIPFHRAAAPEEILAKARGFRRKIILEPDFRRATAWARSAARAAGGSVLVAGSLFLVGAVKKAGTTAGRL